jgi:hypothetical protein
LWRRSFGPTFASLGCPGESARSPICGVHHPWPRLAGATGRPRCRAPCRGPIRAEEYIRRRIGFNAPKYLCRKGPRENVGQTWESECLSVRQAGPAGVPACCRALRRRGKSIQRQKQDHFVVAAVELDARAARIVALTGLVGHLHEGLSDLWNTFGPVVKLAP